MRPCFTAPHDPELQEILLEAVLNEKLAPAEVFSPHSLFHNTSANVFFNLTKFSCVSYFWLLILKVKLAASVPLSFSCSQLLPHIYQLCALQQLLGKLPLPCSKRSLFSTCYSSPYQFSNTWDEFPTTLKTTEVIHTLQG